jgi:hypothetical protein
MPINYPNIVAQATQNTQANLAGELPKDFLDQQAQLAAERGVSSGMGSGSTNASAALLRAYGLTSLNLRNQGQQELAQLRASGLAEARLAQEAAQFAANLSFKEREMAQQMGLSAMEMGFKKAQLAQQGNLAQQEIDQKGRLGGQELGLRGMELAQKGAQFGMTNAYNMRQLGSQERDAAAKRRLAEQQMAQEALQFQQTYGLEQQKVNNQNTQQARATNASLVGNSPYYTPQGSTILGSLGFGGAGAYPQNSTEYFNTLGQRIGPNGW